MTKINIAIDGYSSCGKSTLAKALAAQLGYLYVDTGAMYRAVTLFALNEKLIESSTNFDKEGLIQRLSKIHIEQRYVPMTESTRTFLNGEDVEDEIRVLRVARLVSEVSRLKEVRTKLVELQREMGKQKGVVMDGRDIGTVVFPDAELKLFMTADQEVRVERRFAELQRKGETVTREEVKENLIKRDYIDTHRVQDPLRQAEDAFVIDNSELTQDEQLELAYFKVQKKMLKLL